MIPAAYLALIVAGACFCFRLVRGPSTIDRVVGLNGLLTVGMSAIVVRAVDSGSGAFLPVVIVLALVGFVGTSIIARFIEGRAQ